ncbi:MAG: CoA transferase [Spirosomataceae bacterium]
MNHKRPLDGITVLDFTIALAGPYATFLLAGLGARVIKIENPDGGDVCRNNAPYLGKNGVSLVKENNDDFSISALNRLRDKESITLNLKHPEAKTILSKLIEKADIIVENFSKGTMDKLGLGYDFAKNINPKIIYCAITGFGSSENTGNRKAMDSIIQAMSGVMMTSGAETDPPIRVGVPFADMNAPLFGVIGILAALQQRNFTGEGQYIDISMLGVLTSMVACEPFDILERCGVSQRTGTTVPRLAPFGMFPSKDGFISIAAPTEVFARNLFRVIEKPEMSDDERFNSRDSRVKHEKELNQIIEDFTRQFSTAHLVELFNANNVPTAEVRSPKEAVRDPSVIERGEILPVEHPKYGFTDDVLGMGLPIRMSNAHIGFEKNAPTLGEHNEVIYTELVGLSADDLMILKNKKTI